ncbi:MAG: hypothetical protein U0271_04720 [Polyangiaceae bacterium]
MNRLKIEIENQTGYTLCLPGSAQADAATPSAASASEDFVVVSPATLATDSSLPKSWFKSGESCSFTVESPIHGASPSGNITYLIDAARLRLTISWSDFTKSNDATATPCRCEWAALDGGYGSLAPATASYLDEKGAPVDVATLSKWHEADANAQAAGLAAAAKDPKKAPPIPMRTLTAKFTLKVEPPPTGKAPSDHTPKAPATAVRPSGSSKTVLGSRCWVWDDPDISQRRKKLLAAIGNLFPMTYCPWTFDDFEPEQYAEPKSNVPFHNMNPLWTPGNGTSCTSISTNIEKLLTGSSGKWGFLAYAALEEAWVPWGADPLRPFPNVGDVYLVFSDSAEPPGLRHVGFIAHVSDDPTDKWVTADGGQLGLQMSPVPQEKVNQAKEKKLPPPKPFSGAGGGAFLTVKERQMKKPKEHAPSVDWSKVPLFARPIEGIEYPYLKGGAEEPSRMIGWLDLDSPALSFLDEQFAEPIGDKDLKRKGLELQQRRQWGKDPRNVITENDYLFLGAWIDKLLGLNADLDDWNKHLRDPANTRAPKKNYFLPW